MTTNQEESKIEDVVFVNKNKALTNLDKISAFHKRANNLNYQLEILGWKEAIYESALNDDELNEWTRAKEDLDNQLKDRLQKKAHWIEEAKLIIQGYCQYWQQKRRGLI